MNHNKILTGYQGLFLDTFYNFDNITKKNPVIFH